MKCSACGYEHDHDYKLYDEDPDDFIKIKGLDKLYACPECYTVRFDNR